MARPSKLSPERAEKIIRLIKDGNFSSRAAQASGISERTFHRWMQQGEEAGEKCEAWEDATEAWNDLTDQQRRRRPDLRPDEALQPSEGEIGLWHFWQGVKKAEAYAESEAIGMIQTAANQGTWQAAAWWLERKHRARWGRQDKVTLEGQVDHSHQLLPQSPQQIEEAQRRLAEARALYSGSQAPELPSGAKANGAEELLEAEAVEIEEE